MDASFIIQLLFLSPLIFVPVIAYLVVGRIFQVKDRAMRIIVSLILSLAFASIIPLLLEWGSLLPTFYHISPVFPLNDCNNVVTNANSCPSGAVCDLEAVQSRIGFVICKLSQYYELALIAAAIILILVSFLVSRRAKRKEKAKLVK